MERDDEMMQVNIKLPRDLWNKFSAVVASKGVSKREGLIDLIEQYVQNSDW